MKILVTGGAGFIGSNFVNNLFAGSYSLDFSRVQVLDSLTYAGHKDNINTQVYLDSRFDFIIGDINDQKIVDELVAENDLIINFAAESHVDRSIENPQLFVQTNVLGVANILKSISRTGKKRLVQVSTDEVYGSILNGSWDESFPVSPNSPYSASKASADLLCHSFYKTYELDVVITRCSNNYGPNQFPEKLIPLTIKKLIYGEQVPVYGDGLQSREWIHVDDHCSGIALAAMSGKSGEIYNIGSGHELHNLDLVKSIISLMGLKFDRISHVSDRLGHDTRYSINFDKITAELGYRPQVDFTSGLNATVDWYLEKFSRPVVI